MQQFVGGQPQDVMVDAGQAADRPIGDHLGEQFIQMFKIAADAR